MSRSFSINLKKDFGTLIDKAKNIAKEHGVNFSGDTISGTFSGKGLEGRYKIEAESAAITITKKPLIIPWALIETKVTEFFT